MAYEEVATRLRDGEAARVVTLPDGSLDTHCDVTGVPDREAFASAVVGGRSAFDLAVDAVRPGGQAVNMARQAAALGDSVTCYGHLADPRFDALPFEGVSMGDPAEVTVLRLDGGDLQFAVESADIESWTGADLRAAAGGDLAAFGAPDAVCCGNWVSFPALRDALPEVADAVTDGGVFVLDPGDVTDCDATAVGALLEALAVLDGPFDAVLSVDPAEVARLAAAVGADGDPATAVRAVRDAAGAGTVVCHGADRAVADDGSGAVRVRNLSTDPVTTDTGAGDRFGAGVAHALALDWPLRAALALGNVCAARYVETGETGGAADLASFAAARA